MINTTPSFTKFQLNAPHGRGYLSAGSLHTCVIRVNDDANCWGSNAQGRLGIGSLAASVNIPQTVLTVGAPKWSWIEAGDASTCGLVWFNVTPGIRGGHCAGRNAQGQLGIMNTVDQNTAVATGMGSS